MSKYVLNLQRFAEGAAAGEGTGVNNDDAGHDGKKAPVPEEIFESGADGEKDVKGDEPEEESFDDLIKGRYKKDFNSRVEGIVQKRIRNMQDSLDKINPVMSLMAEKYGVKADDVDAIAQAVLEDDSYYEAEAQEKGMDVATLKHIRQLERQNEQFAENIRERDNQQQREEAWKEVLDQCEEVKKIYPDFDIEEEMQNEQFGMLVAANVPVKTAFEVVHQDEIQPQVMKYVADKTAKKVADSVKSNKRRPQEGSGSAQPLRIKKSISSLSDAERDEINRRVLEGEIISW